jgi:two-component system, NtrC family, response regulator GlrR
MTEPSTTDALPTDAGFALVRRFRLDVRSGPAAGTHLASEAERVVIGSHEGADMVLADGSVSRYHCELDITSGRPLARDLTSRNGTLVDGVPIVAAYLREGSVLTLGRSEVVFTFGPDHVRLALSRRDRFGQLLGASRAMRRVFAQLERAAATDSTVLIEGETGTGKEAAAESLHAASSRAKAPFVVVDCAAVAGELLESELFGHERGSFHRRHLEPRRGVRGGPGGTIFLDEIGELAGDLQPKLLRALERREVKRIGCNRFTKVDVRVVAATNRDLRAEVNAKRFRGDLYFRLAVLGVRLPPLRDRLDDLPLLVSALLEALHPRAHERARLLDAAYIADLALRSWDGNVRELRNHLARSLAMGDEGVEHGEVGPSLEASITEPPDEPLKTARARFAHVFERRYVETMLARYEGNVSRAARAAGVDRMYFYRLLWKHGLR